MAISDITVGKTDFLRCAFAFRRKTRKVKENKRREGLHGTKQGKTKRTMERNKKERLEDIKQFGKTNGGKTRIKGQGEQSKKKHAQKKWKKQNGHFAQNKMNKSRQPKKNKQEREEETMQKHWLSWHERKKTETSRERRKEQHRHRKEKQNNHGNARTEQHKKSSRTTGKQKENITNHIETNHTFIFLPNFLPSPSPHQSSFIPFLSCNSWHVVDGREDL